VRNDDPALVLAEVDAITHASDVEAMVRGMKMLIPEYRSHNSVFSNFDPPVAKP